MNCKRCSGAWSSTSRTMASAEFVVTSGCEIFVAELAEEGLKGRGGGGGFLCGDGFWMLRGP